MGIDCSKAPRFTRFRYEKMHIESRFEVRIWRQRDATRRSVRKCTFELGWDDVASYAAGGEVWLGEKNTTTKPKSLVRKPFVILLGSFCGSEVREMRQVSANIVRHMPGKS